MADTAVPTIIGLPQPFGVFLIAIWISLVLFGIIVVQTWNYFSSFPDDPLWQRVYVGCIFTVDFLCSFFILWWMYDLLINDWGNIEPYNLIHWALITDPLFEGLIGPMVQAYYAWRIHVISGTWWLSGLVMLCSLMAVGGGLAGTNAAATLKTFQNLAEAKVVVIFWLLPPAVADIIIAFSLTYYLRQHKGRFEASDKVLDRIIRMTVQNGLLTAVIAVIDIIMYFTVTTPYHIGKYRYELSSLRVLTGITFSLAFTFILPKLYANTVLSSLNSRTSIRRDLSNRSDGHGLSSGGVSALHRTQASGVIVTVETHEMQDTVKRNVEWDSDHTSADTKPNNRSPTWLNVIAWYFSYFLDRTLYNMIAHQTLYTLANALGIMAMATVIGYHFVAVNSKYLSKDAQSKP
ncbi:hypothetical protein ARMSODRAFT_1019335 [Armillaria solidipes]|uniref:DUF6534 domain-containing protein n=1 Tax=Armillaria solidipes TaxID=1076256 RepID=A0A2H3BGD6_9AGAR|nr:hypothetical protein ARMSODRAFT_1019335 [Armillaria solidipes]